MGGLAGDVRFALRTMRRSPGLTAAAVFALALGIGANTAIFSVVDGVLLRPLPYPNAGALYTVHCGARAFPLFNGPFSFPDLKDLQAQSRVFDSVGAWTDGDANLSSGSSPERVLTRVATPSLLPTLGVQPILGRNFLPDETHKGNDRVAIIDYGLWQRQLGGTADAIGRALRLDGVDYKIVGVLPRGFSLERHIDVWIPLSTAFEMMDIRNAHFLHVLGHARAGVSRTDVLADTESFGQRLTATWPDTYPPTSGWGTRARPYQDELVGDMRLALFVLLGAVLFVLLIACANVANLLLARAATRTREMAVRTALGAGRWRLVRQLLTESLLMSLTGGILGVVAAAWGIDLLVGMAPDAPRASEIALDGRVLAFTFGVAVITGIAFGLVPAIAASRPDINDALKDGTRGTTSGKGRMRKALVVAEVAISLVLLVGAGLMVRSFLRLRAVDAGFTPEHALTLRVSLPVADNVATPADNLRFIDYFTRATKRLRQLPGVTAAGAAPMLPLDGNSTDLLFDIEGYVPVDKADRPNAQEREVTAGYFEAMGMRLVRGRFFTVADDDAAAPHVAIVNEAMLRKYFKGGDGVGKRIRVKTSRNADPPWSTIIGVIADVRGYGLDSPPQPEMYWPMAQGRSNSAMAIVVRTGGDPKTLVASARAAMAEIDAKQPLFDVKPLEEVVAASLAQRRFTLTLMMLFGLVALVLAAVGIYGVMAYGVAQRTQEIGIRVALGAQPHMVLGMVLGEGMRLVALGLVLGAVAALALTRVAASLLYGVSATDTLTYAAVAAVLAGVAFVAIVIPARRATRVDPMQALRSE